MAQEKSSDELAMELRIRLVREVAVPASEAVVLLQRVDELKHEIKFVEVDRKKFLEALGVECVSLIEREMLGISFMEIEEKHRAYLNESTQVKSDKEKELIEKELLVKALNTKAREAFALIVNDVLACKYGAGELKLTHQGLDRIIGRIGELNESISGLGIYIVTHNEPTSRISMQQIVQMCENQRQQPPIFHIGTDVMPMSEEESRKLCRSNDDFKLLEKYISIERMIWETSTPYCIERNAILEVFIVPLDEMKFVIVRMKRNQHFYCILEELGIASCNADTLSWLKYWGGLSEVSIETKKTPPNMQARALITVMKHVFNKEPGLIFKTPQLENEN